MRIRVTSVVFSLILVSARGGAQQTLVPVSATATVRVRVVDSTSGKPVTSAGVQANNWNGLARTNDSGEVTMRDVPRRTDLLIRCPTRRWMAGRIVRRQPLSLATVQDTLIVVPLGESECLEPPIRSVRGEFRGHYTVGFESSDFRPCGGLPAEVKAFDEQWGAAWVRFSPKLDLSRTKWPQFADTVHYPTVYVRWTGTLTGPSSYGHMGVATYELLVDRLLEVRHTRPSDCE
jgi:hypothetical protein